MDTNGYSFDVRILFIEKEPAAHIVRLRVENHNSLGLGVVVNRATASCRLPSERALGKLEMYLCIGEEFLGEADQS